MCAFGFHKKILLSNDVSVFSSLGATTPSALNTYYKYSQVSPDVGIPWRDGASIDINPTTNKLTYYGGWNDQGAFTPGPSTDQVVESSNSGASFSISSTLSPAWGGSPKHFIGRSNRTNGDRIFYGGDPYTPAAANQVWRLRNTTYTLLVPDWGIGPIFIFRGITDSNQNMYVFGGQNDVNTVTPIMNLNVYRSTDGGLTWPVWTTLPAGYYSTSVLWETPTSIILAGGGQYITGGVVVNFNDKVLAINKTTGAVNQIGTLSSNMQGMYPSSTRFDNKYWFLKGTDINSVNSQGLWYIDSFPTETSVELIAFTSIVNPLIYGRQQLPLASHARPIINFSGSIFGAFGNERNDSWQINKITANFYLSPYLIDWYTSLAPEDRPTEEPVAENTLLDSIGAWVDFLAVSCLDNDGQRLRPLVTTSGEVMQNNGVGLAFGGFTGNGSSQYINTKWNLFDNGIRASKDDNLILCYITSNPTGAQDRVIGGSLVGASESSIWPLGVGNIFYGAANQNGEAFTASAFSTGFKGVRRQDGSSVDLIDNAAIINKSFPSQDPNASDEFLAAISNTGTAQLFHNATNAMWLRAKGNIDLTVLLNALTTYFTAKGL